MIDRNFVSNLPLNGGSFNTLQQLTLGVAIAVTPVGAIGPSPGQFSIAGQRADSNNFTVNGVVGNSTAGVLGKTQALTALGTTNSAVSTDALQEFGVVTAFFCAEYWRMPGRQVTNVTRSGTNQLHGSAFHYLRNDVLDVNNWFKNRAEKQDHRDGRTILEAHFAAQFTGTRTFFFFSYEGFRLFQPASPHLLKKLVESS